MRSISSRGRRGARPAPIEARVDRVESTGDFVRITLGGDALRSAFVWPGSASHLKLFPPATGHERSETNGRPTSRTYTPRSFNPSRGELVIDILLHGDGPAASWARQASIGERLTISIPRATWSPPDDADWLLLAGDDSAIPAISTILEGETPANTTVMIETTSLRDSRPELPTESSVMWLAARPNAPGSVLEDAIATFHQPAGSGAVWVACEAMAVRRIRRHLIEDRALPVGSIVTRGYWRSGESNHPDHDFGEDS